jgi:hypothetical protein
VTTTTRVRANEAMRKLLRYLQTHGRNVDQDKAGGPTWFATCPNHDGRSGMIRLDQHVNGTVTVHPHRENGAIICEPEAILGAISVTDDRIKPYSNNDHRSGLGSKADPFAHPARPRNTDGPVEDSHEIFERLKKALVEGGYDEGRGASGRYRCPACGAKGDGHGLKIDHKPNAFGAKRKILLHCHANRCPDEEILEPLEMTPADICAGDDVDDLHEDEDAPDPVDNSQNQPPQPEPTDAGYERFWKERPVLQHLHDFARARVAAPWAVLGVALVRATCAVQPSVKLPAIVGSRASLNLFLGLVGESGSGKSVAKAVARDALDFGDRTIEDFPIGTGEGIAATYMRLEKRKDEPPELVQHRFRALFHADEIDGVKAISSRNGATLLPVLRSAYSGETLGNQNADIHRRLPVTRHSYRLGFIAGIQPARSAILLDDADGGTPQRILWMPTVDPDAPDDPPAEPVRLPILIPPAMRGDLGPLEITVCQTAIDLIRRTHLARIRGGNSSDLLDGHGLLTRLKVAAALGILDGRLTVTDEDWQLAEIIMAVSDHTRARCQAVLAAKTRQQNTTRAEAEGQRQVIAGRVVEEDAVKRVARLILRKLTHEWISHAGLRRSLNGARDRQYFDDAIERLLKAGLIDREETENKGPDGLRYQLAENAS